MGSDNTNHTNLTPSYGPTSDSTITAINADKANISSLKTAIAVQARLVAELRKEVDKLKAPNTRAERRSTVNQ